MHTGNHWLKALVCALAVPAMLDAPALPAAETAHAEGLSHSAAAIHQETDYPSSCARVYRALTRTSEFDALTRLSDAATLLTAPGAKATMISDEVGAPFTLFGGYITGRNLEVVRNQRLVQAWRAGSWDPGEYSVVRFELQSHGSHCTVAPDQRGFPDKQGSSLAYGWRVHYWEPLGKLLSQQ
jgi:activator of HSP90 ATPase